jgi:hypothetical protein
MSAARASGRCCPEHDHAAADEMLVPNRWQTVRLVADGGLIQYWNDGRKLFELDDAEPYTRGWFGLRTTLSHLRVRFGWRARVPFRTALARSGTDLEVPSSLRCARDDNRGSPQKKRPRHAGAALKSS